MHKYLKNFCIKLQCGNIVIVQCCGQQEREEGFRKERTETNLPTSSNKYSWLSSVKHNFLFI